MWGTEWWTRSTFLEVSMTFWICIFNEILKNVLVWSTAEFCKWHLVRNHCSTKSSAKSKWLILQRPTEAISSTRLWQKAQTGMGGGWRGSSSPLDIRILMFLFLIFHQHWSRDGVHCRMSLGSTTRRSNTFVVKPGGYEFSRLRNIEAVFFIPA